MNYGNIAKQIARDIFAIGNNGDDKCQRIELLGGSYPDKETSNGGLNEIALAEVILDSLLATNAEVK